MKKERLAMQSGSDYLSASKAMQAKMLNDYSLDNPVVPVSSPGNVYASNGGNRGGMMMMQQPPPSPMSYGISNSNRLPAGMVVGNVGRR